MFIDKESCYYCDGKAEYSTLHQGIYICSDCVLEYANSECIEEI